MTFNYFLEIQVVGDHADDVDGEGADAPAVQQVIQAVAEAGNHKDDFALGAFIEELVFHLVFFNKMLELFLQVFQRLTLFRAERDPHEIVVSAFVVKLCTVTDVAAARG
ncbi:hypothetical protein D3C77_646620 [compost metagenome]